MPTAAQLPAISLSNTTVYVPMCRFVPPLLRVFLRGQPQLAHHHPGVSSPLIFTVTYSLARAVAKVYTGFWLPAAATWVSVTLASAP